MCSSLLKSLSSGCTFRGVSWPLCFLLSALSLVPGHLRDPHSSEKAVTPCEEQLFSSQLPIWLSLAGREEGVGEKHSGSENHRTGFDRSHGPPDSSQSPSQCPWVTGGLEPAVLLCPGVSGSGPITALPLPSKSLRSGQSWLFLEDLRAQSLFLQDRVSLCGLGCPGAPSID